MSDRPQPGFFKMRLTRGGPWVPARIVRECRCTIGSIDECPHEWTVACDRFAPLTCYVNGDERPEFVQRAWLYGRRIEQDEYDFMVADASWAQKYAPDDPKARPTEAADIKNMPIPEF